jgi:molybdenum cofactor cytidylyltransferase
MEDVMTLGGAVLLAAGIGRRIGGRPKSLLRVDGDLLIHRQIRVLKRLSIAPIMVVLGHHAEAISEALADERGVIPVYQPLDEHSQSSSLRLGLGALPGTTGAVLVIPLDMPLLDEAAYEALLDAWSCREASTTILGPVVGGTPGNPVVISSDIVPSIVAGEGPYGSGRWRGTDSPGLEHWESENPAYITDIDTEEDRVRVASRFGLSLMWDES